MTELQFACWPFWIYIKVKTGPMHQSLLGIRGILDFARSRMKVDYAENTRESIRKYSVKQLVAAGILLFNPDDPKRVTNSSKNSYKIDELALSLFKRPMALNVWKVN